ncbi:MAG: hypothetical protein E6G92_12860 [Alphaproteobacteria bacterium]|nr:MAG: hypothetical protein E6G92_12860 [Alphaproteobacteria bacterium]
MVVRKAERLAVPKSALPDFTPVPRKQPRHDGWTPERQRAFIGFLADTGCVSIACRMVNMSQPSYYQLRRQPGAESFRAAADAAQTLGLQCAKDEAFDRAMNGELIPVFVAGKLMGFRRKKNDRLLMFILRHYGQDAQGRKTTINYFSTKATAGAATSSPSPLAGEGRLVEGERGEGAAAALAAAESSTTTVKTVISGNPTPPGIDDASAANLINDFAGVDLDPQAQAEIYCALESAAERRRALDATPEQDRDRIWIGAAETNGYLGQLESGAESDWIEYRPEGEHAWEGLGKGGEAAEIDEVLAGIEARKAAMTPDDLAAQRAAEDAMARDQHEKQNRPLPGYLGGANPALPAPDLNPDDPMLDWRNWKEGAYTSPQNPPRNGEGDQPEPSAAAGGGAAAPAAEALSEGEGPEPSSAHPEPVERRTHRPRKRSPGHVPSEACPEPVEGLEPVPAQARKRRTPSPSMGEGWGGGGATAASAAEISTPEPKPKRTHRPRGPYKKRQPKPRFTAPDAAAYEARKAEAVAAVETERRVEAKAEAERRKTRSRRN